MISKERLQELIDKGASVWTMAYQDSPYEIDFSLYKNLQIINGLTLYYGCYIIDLKDLYETKEDAEFASRYKHIPRTEWLDLPTWEEIWKDKMQEFQFNFIVNGFSFYCSIYGFTKTFLISCSHGKYKNSYKLEKCFTLDTKENYLSACEIARKLFIGEEIE